MKKHEQIAKYAYENSIFYREYIGYKNGNNEHDDEINGNHYYVDTEEDSERNQDGVAFEKLPIVCKEDIVESRLPLCPAKYLISNDEDNVIKMSTSGSTGKILEIEWNKEDFYRSMTELWMFRKKYYDISTKDRMCYFYTISKIGQDEALEYESNYTLGFSKTSLDEIRIKEVYERMQEYEPVWLLLQPSTISLIFDVVEKYNLSAIKSVRYIELSGEMLSDGLRDKIKNFFQCSVANQYGSYEFNSIAYECPYGNMHVMGSNVYVEAFSDEQKNVGLHGKDKKLCSDSEGEKICSDDRVSIDEEKELVITSLMNKRNPFIRYKIGDKGILMKDINCKCGNHNPVIKLTVGRSHSYIECEDGSKINAYILLRAVDNINLLLDDVVKQFQVIQRAVNDFKVRMYIDDRSQIPAIMEIFEENILDKSLQNAKFEYCFEEGYIKDEHGDKLMYFRRED